MGYYALSKAWAAEVGNGVETGRRTWTEYNVHVEYIECHPNDPKKQYYMRCDQWFHTREDVDDFLKNFDYGKIRQAWIDKVVTTKIRERYYDSPHNIPSGCKWE